MRFLALVSVMVLACLVAFGAAAYSDDQLHSITRDGITVFYPEEFERQAKEVARTAAKVISPYREAFQITATALSDKKKIANSTIREYHAEEVVSSMMSEYRLFRESDIRKASSLQVGPWTLKYIPSSDSFKCRFFTDNNADLRKSFTPVIIRTTGAIYTDDKLPLGAWIESAPKVLVLSAFFPIHEVTELVVAGEMRLDHPFTRWFNEGVADWVMLRIADDLTPHYAEELRSKTLPGKNYTLRGRVNLISWIQCMYERQNLNAEEADISKACYAYATEAVSRMLDNQPPETLAKILQKLKGQNNPYSDVILAAVKEVTGKNATSILLDYVPTDVRPLFGYDSMKELSSQAVELAKQSKYDQVRKIFTDLLQAFPHNTDARLDYAWALRKTGQPKEEFERQIRIVGECLQSGDASFNLITDDADMHYVLGRLLEMNKNKDPSKEEYAQALKADPNHADAKAALDELNKAK